MKTPWERTLKALAGTEKRAAASFEHNMRGENGK
jgi:hypothetical protein